MLTIKNLKKVYDNGYEALQSIDLDIREGELMCLLGPSGCGKSTMLNIIAGLLDPSAGDILSDGKSIIDWPPGDRQIGMVFQNYAIYPHMTVLENVIFPLRVGKHKVSRREAEEKARHYMELTAITELADKKPASLSGGQQQRVAITRALMQNPRVLLLDEPLSNLDARLRLRIREEIRRLVKKIGITTIFVTHDQEEAMSISDRIALMNEGVIQQVAAPQDLYLDPANLFVARFIGNPAINLYRVRKEGDRVRGQTLDLPLADFPKLASFTTEGTLPEQLILGIRPEHFALKEAGPLRLEVEAVEMIGRYEILHFDLEGQDSQAVVDSRLRIQEGDTVSFDLDKDSLFLFDESGRRLA